MINKIHAYWTYRLSALNIPFCRSYRYVFITQAWSHIFTNLKLNLHCDLVLFQFSSIQLSHSVVSDSLQPHVSQHARPPCPSPTPGVHSNSSPSSQWCHSAISSFVAPSSSSPQSFPASGFFQWVNTLHEVAKVLELQPQHQSFQWTPRTDLL